MPRALNPVGAPGPRFWRRPVDGQTTHLISDLLEDTHHPIHHRMVRCIRDLWETNTPRSRAEAVREIKHRMVSYLLSGRPRHTVSPEVLRGLRKARWDVITRRLMAKAKVSSRTVYHD